jgi:predicted RNase H-like HicB family nuclease
MHDECFAMSVLGSAGIIDQKPNMRYILSIKTTDDGISVWAPGLPGCWSQGETEDEALENIRDAIREYLDSARELAVR